MGLLPLIVVACDIITIRTDAGPSDAMGDASGEPEIDASAWLALCKQFFFQPGFGSATCSNCMNSSCSTEQMNELSACVGDTDNLCVNQCGQAPPFPSDHCTCLQSCLTAGCQAEYPPYETCELSACGSSCQ
jgi:hypothetical protein